MPVLGEVETNRRLRQDLDIVKQVDAGNRVASDVIRARSQAEIDALPTEQRWREYGKTYEEEQEYRREHDQNPDGTAKFTSENIIGGVITGLLIAGAVVVTGGLILDAITPAAASTSGVIAQAAGVAPLAPAAALAPLAPAATIVAAPIVTQSAIVVATETVAGMGLFDQALSLLKSPSGGAIVNALTGNNPSAASAQQAASQQAAIDKLSSIAEDALSTAQSAVLGQKPTQNNSTASSSSSIPMWVWWIIGGVFVVPLFIWLLVLLFKALTGKK